MAIETVKDLEAWKSTVEARLGERWASQFTTNGRDEKSLHELGSFLKYQGARGLRPENRDKVMANLDKNAAEKAWTEVRKADLGTPLYSDATTGSYLIPVQYLGEVQRVADLESTFKGKVRQVNMTTNTCSVPLESTALSLSWVAAQSSAHSEINPTFDTLTLTAYTVSGWIGTTQSLLEDNAVGMGTYFSECWGQKYGLEIDKQILNGTGTPCTGVFQGLSGIHTVTQNAGDTTHEDIDADYLLDMISELSGAQRKGACFVMSPVAFDVVRGLKDANGRFIVDFLANNPPSILGYPCYLCDSAPSAPGADAAYVYFGNPKYIMLGVRKDLEIKFYPDTAYNVEWDQVFWRARARLAIGFPIPSAIVVLKTAAS